MRYLGLTTLCQESIPAALVTPFPGPSSGQQHRNWRWLPAPATFHRDASGV